MHISDMWKTPFLGNFQKLKSDQSLIMSQTNNLNHNLNMILVPKFDDIKKDIETQWVWGNTEDKDKIFALNLWCKNVAAT